MQDQFDWQSTFMYIHDIPVTLFRVFSFFEISASSSVGQISKLIALIYQQMTGFKKKKLLIFIMYVQVRAASEAGRCSAFEKSIDLNYVDHCNEPTRLIFKLKERFLSIFSVY